MRVSVIRQLIVVWLCTSIQLSNASFFGFFKKLKCDYFDGECCDNDYIKSNYKGLKSDLNRKVYGQPLVVDVVYRAIKGHVKYENPKRPLVMSFHGTTGVGKNYVSRMIIDNLYEKGMKSSFVHFWNAEVHFKNPKDVYLYKDQIQNWLHGNVSRCERSIFVFDEVDQMVEGVIDAVKPYLGENLVRKVDYRKCIFIFLSNTGGKAIAAKCMSVWEKGKYRRDIKLPDLEKVLLESAYNYGKGLGKSGIVDKYLISHLVPFMPLEKNHVRMCISDELERLDINENAQLVNEILREIHEWFPEFNHLYSSSGCKRLYEKTKLVAIEQKYIVDGKTSEKRNQIQSKMDL